jgi:hypothetical protein
MDSESKRKGCLRRRWSMSLSARRNWRSQKLQLWGVAAPCTLSMWRCLSYFRRKVFEHPRISHASRLESVIACINHRMEKNRISTYCVRESSEFCLVRDVELLESGPNWYPSLPPIPSNCGKYASCTLDGVDRL